MIQVQIQNPIHRELIIKAFVRSFTRGQVVRVDQNPSVMVCDHIPSNTTAQKIIVFGKRPFQHQRITTIANILSAAPQAVPEITYFTHELTQNLHLKTRAFERYDFTREWNNLGYGRIETDTTSPWGIGEWHTTESPYIQLLDETHRSIIWVNRNVGPIDGFDWRIIEDFISNYRCDPKFEGGALPCLPVMSEIPADFNGAVTMRIDCDENIESGRALFELYRNHGLPFSLAIKTEQKIDDAAIKLMNEVMEAGGAVVSHSHTHAPNWGGSEEKALWEAETSLKVLKQALPGYPIVYAVSPFHQNPTYAVKGIMRGGMDAFVGGIIQNDPEYLMARSGEVPFANDIISHSQQCMLHGDCYHQAGNSISVYLEALKSALKTETFFGYLDHPFSNYQYGWNTEEERLKVHDEFIGHIKNLDKIWFASLGDTLDFLWDRAHTHIKFENDQIKTGFLSNKRSKQKLKARLRNKEIVLT